MTGDPSDFGAVANFEGDEATISLRGTTTSGAAFMLGALLDSAIDRQPASIILDVSDLESLGTSGLLAISDAERRLAEMGITLTLRSPSALVNRLLDIMESAESSRLERSLPGHGHLGAEQVGGPAGLPRPFTSSLSSEGLRRVTALPTEPGVVDGALRLVVELARVTIPGADGVSVSLLRNGVLSTVAASDDTILAMDADQYSTGQGPCVDASVKGHWFHAESLDTETRWPAFTPQARSLGIKSILSSPLRAFEEPVGALNIYSRTSESFEVEDQESAAVFARQASVILSDARADVSDTKMAFRFEEALRCRRVISLAEGVIMEREGIGEKDAFSFLLRSTLDQGIPLREGAEVMVRSARPPELGPEWDLDD